MPDSDVQEALQQCVDHWPCWNSPLGAKPVLTKAINTGLSHSTFLFEGISRQGELLQFIMRIENPASRELAIPLSEEVRLMELAAGIAPQVIYTNQHALVTERLIGSHRQNGNNLSAIGRTLAQLHQHRSSGLRSIDLKNHCESYWHKLGQPAESAPIFSSYQKHLIQTLGRYPQQCLCHNDLNPDNIILQGSTARLIDWEYAGLNSPYFDIASLIEMLQLNEEQTQELSLAYWGEKLLKERRNALRDFQIIVRFVNWLWFSLKSENQLANENLQRIMRLN